MPIKRCSPFNLASWEWRWPEALTVERDASTLIVHSPKDDRTAVDLRALTLLEAAQRGVLSDGAPVASVRIHLGRAWKDLSKLVARVGLLRARGFPELSLWHDGEPVATPDRIGAWRDFFATCTSRTTFGGHKIELLATALDTWIASIQLALDAIDSESLDLDPGDAPTVRLETLDGRVHPRLYWIAARLQAAGLPVDLPGAPPVSSLTYRLELTSASYRQGLGFPEGRHGSRSYPFILPREHAKFAIWKPLRASLDEDLPPRDRHQYFHNLKSSQAFAVNFFGGLHHTQQLGVLIEAACGRRPRSWSRPKFELVPAGMKNLLGELGKHQTQVDVAVVAEMVEGRELFLFEVKLTESRFGACRGPRSGSEEQQAHCQGRGSGERRTGCYLAQTHQRRYLEHPEAFPEILARFGLDGGCPLRSDGYQLARNLIVARWLENRLRGAPVPPPKEWTADRVHFVVLSAKDTPAVQSKALAELGTTPRERLEALGAGWLDAAEILENVDTRHPVSNDFLSFMMERYGPIFG